MNLAERTIRWFDMTADREPVPDEMGIAQFQVFPGLWLDLPALFREDSAKIQATLSAGLSSAAHREFTDSLSARRRAVTTGEAQFIPS